jgi:hypothetical protein
MLTRSIPSYAVLIPVAVLITGCPSVAPPENAVTWGIKAATGRLTDTTVREWQAVAEKIDARTPEVELSLNDAQAQAIVDFVQANELDSIQDVLSAIETAQNDPASLADDFVIPDSVIDLFTDGAADLQSVVNESQ